MWFFQIWKLFIEKFINLFRLYIIPFQKMSNFSLNLIKSLLNFLSPILKLHNQYCHFFISLKLYVKEYIFFSFFYQAEKIKELENKLKKFESLLEDKTKSLENKLNTHINHFIASKLPSNSALNISGLDLSSVNDIPIIKAKMVKVVRKTQGIIQLLNINYVPTLRSILRNGLTIVTTQIFLPKLLFFFLTNKSIHPTFPLFHLTNFSTYNTNL